MATLPPLEAPFWAQMRKAKTVLVAGAGGGFDVFNGLPLYFALRRMGIKVHLANLTFSGLDGVAARCPQQIVCPCWIKGPGASGLVQAAPQGCIGVTKDTIGYSEKYFPEGYLAQWFSEARGEDVTIYTFERCGVVPLRKSYEAVIEKLGVDTVVVVDGGSDSLMSGNEEQLASFQEDFSTLVAVNSLSGQAAKMVPLERRMLMVVGLGVDRFHGCSDVASLRAVAELTQAGGYLGAIQLHPQMDPVKQYEAACEFVFKKMPSMASIVATTVLTSVKGGYGNMHHKATVSRTGASKLWVNPMMSFCWNFYIKDVVKRMDTKMVTGLMQANSLNRGASSVTRIVLKRRHELRETGKLLAVEEFPRTHDFSV